MKTCFGDKAWDAFHGISMTLNFAKYNRTDKEEF
jgi:hypothetical protein